jgi:hypothetical protein
LIPSLFIERDALISECGKYRYWLTRRWQPKTSRGHCVWIMLNPSTADASVDDPTIRRCIDFAMRWGFDGLDVLNLFSFRATDPEDLYAAAHPVCAPDEALRFHDLLIERCQGRTAIAAWGSHGGYRGRGPHIIDLFSATGIPLKCLGLTKDGHPRHPLYVRADTPLRDLSSAIPNRTSPIATADGGGD